MNKEQVMVEAFHQKFNQPWMTTPFMQQPEELLHRSRLITEECAEFVAAASQEDMAGMADALVDILYVVYGTACSLGIDLEPIFQAVHEKNMTKINGPGKKVCKPEGYTPVDFDSLLRSQGYGI